MGSTRRGHHVRFLRHQLWKVLFETYEVFRGKWISTCWLSRGLSFAYLGYRRWFAQGGCSSFLVRWNYRQTPYPLSRERVAFSTEGATVPAHNSEMILLAISAALETKAISGTVSEDKNSICLVTTHVTSLPTSYISWCCGQWCHGRNSRGLLGILSLHGFLPFCPPSSNDKPVVDGLFSRMTLVGKVLIPLKSW